MKYTPHNWHCRQVIPELDIPIFPKNNSSPLDNDKSEHSRQLNVSPGDCGDRPSAIASRLVPLSAGHILHNPAEYLFQFLRQAHKISPRTNPHQCYKIIEKGGHLLKFSSAAK